MSAQPATAIRGTLIATPASSSPMPIRNPTAAAMTRRLWCTRGSVACTASANRGSSARSACSICSSWRCSCLESGTVPSDGTQAERDALVGVRLTAWLMFRVRALTSARAGDADALERARLKFPTAAIAVLEFTGTWQELGPERAPADRFRGSPGTPRRLRRGIARTGVPAAMLADDDGHAARAVALSHRQPGHSAVVTPTRLYKRLGAGTATSRCVVAVLCLEGRLPSCRGPR